MSLRFFRRWTCNRSEPGECCNAEIAASRSRCSCCKRASCSRNSRSSSLVIATADSKLGSHPPASMGAETRKKYPFLPAGAQAQGGWKTTRIRGLLHCTIKTGFGGGAEGGRKKGSGDSQKM